MFSSETREVVYIAASLMLLSVVLGFIAIVTSIRSDLATIRNEEIATAIQMRDYREFNKYNNVELFSDDVVEIISKYKNSDVTIYVNNVHGTGTPMLLNKEIYKTTPSDYTLYEMQTKFKPNPDKEDVYNVYLAYDFEDVTTINSSTNMSGNYTEVTGIAIRYKTEVDVITTP